MGGRFANGFANVLNRAPHSLERVLQRERSVSPGSGRALDTSTGSGVHTCGGDYSHPGAGARHRVAPMINARAETVAERPSFRAALSRRRCLIPADGFYEWRRDSAGRRPVRITLASGESFAFACLWETWQDPNGGPVISCAIITTQANELLQPIHDRMPVILPRDFEALWLDDETQDAAAIVSLLAPYPSDAMETYEVSRRGLRVARRAGADFPPSQWR